MARTEALTAGARLNPWSGNCIPHVVYGEAQNTKIKFGCLKKFLDHLLVRIMHDFI